MGQKIDDYKKEKSKQTVKYELHITHYIKSNGAIGMKKVWAKEEKK